MVTVDCPWCSGPAEVVASSVRCEACGVSEEIVDAGTDAADLPVAA